MNDFPSELNRRVDKTLLVMKKSHETNYEVDHGLLILSRRLIDAVQYAMDNGLEVVKRVRANCGDPQGSTVGSSLERTSTTQSLSPTNLLTGPTKTIQGLTDRLQMKLMEIHGLFGTLSEQLCPVSATTNCWTGTEKGAYTKTTAGRGVKAQRLNPEVTFNEHQTPNYVPLVNLSLQMQVMTKELVNAGVVKIRPANANYQGIETRQQRPSGYEGSGAFEGSGDGEGSGRDSIRQPSLALRI
ncbi:glypican-5-like [Tropilaelaps mercedesae]|uniref:Glypican-5-like n=1 Tax=Tropilaelaps mercedesae TaxID=418985 RepID=A0A1V9WY80_9ACAR|nr:glypican-5-like [Tropilaelaps mercedesae]